MAVVLCVVAAAPRPSGASARPASDPTDFFAVVNADGTLARGTPGTSVIHTGTGLYDIAFPESVAGCAAAANLGYAGTSEEFTFSSVVTVSLSGDTALVDVTYPGDTSAGLYPQSPVLRDNSFDIQVDCNDALFAVVGANGSLVRGSPGVRTSGRSTAPGKYVVDFDRELSMCAPVGTVQDGPGRSAFPAQVHLALGADGRSLTVWVNAASREPIEWGFYVIVTCGEQPARVFPVSEGFWNQMKVPSALLCAFTASWYDPAPGSSPQDQGYVSTWATSSTTATVQTKNGGYGVQPGFGVDLVATCGSHPPPSQLNGFDVFQIRTHADGTIAMLVKVPGAGSVDVMVTAWRSNIATTDAARIAVLQPAPRRVVAARGHANPPAAREIALSVKPNADGRRLVRNPRYRVVLRVWVTYTPTTTHGCNLGFYGLHLRSLYRAPDHRALTATHAHGCQRP